MGVNSVPYPSIGFIPIVVVLVLNSLMITY
jgi:hypothetical protein